MRFFKYLYYMHNLFHMVLTFIPYRRLLITFANRLDPDQARQNVATPERNFREKLILKKKIWRRQKNNEKNYQLANSHCGSSWLLQR